LEENRNLLHEGEGQMGRKGEIGGRRNDFLQKILPFLLPPPSSFNSSHPPSSPSSLFSTFFLLRPLSSFSLFSLCASLIINYP